MALALAAVAGLMFAGKSLSDAKEEQAEPQQVLVEAAPPMKITSLDTDLMEFRRSQDATYDSKIMNPGTGRGFAGNPDWRLQPKEVAPNFGDITKDGKRFPFGQPVYTTVYRENITNKMNNLNPTEKMNVGRGLGLDPNVPAAGGFQQFFRVLPNNINEERTHNLPGNWGGPANPVVKNGGTTMGEITHHAKPTKAWNRPPAQNRGQGQGGALTALEGRPDFQKTRRTTIRQETGSRRDTLENGPPQYYQTQGYDSTLLDNRQTRWSENRSNPDRAGNPGRMNVRQDPIGMVGAGTTTRLEAGPLPIRPPDGSHNYRYIAPQYDRLNIKKGNATPMDLNLAKDVRTKNPLAQPAFSSYAS
jgi:hypothetical protein